MPARSPRRWHQTLPDRTGTLPTSARPSAAGGSRSRDSAWILCKRSLRSVFCARAWNTVRTVFQKGSGRPRLPGPRPTTRAFSWNAIHPAGDGSGVPGEQEILNSGRDALLSSPAQRWKERLVRPFFFFDGERKSQRPSSYSDQHFTAPPSAQLCPQGPLGSPGWAPAPRQTPKPTDAQVPCIKGVVFV